MLPWVRKSYDVPAYSSDRRSRRVECLWLSPNLVKGPEEQAGTPTDRMREGAHAPHRARASQTEAKLRAVIGKRRDDGEVINISAVEMSREHLSRRYNYLFSDGP